MKKIKRVNQLEIKRCFVISNFIASPLIKRKRKNQKHFLKSVSLKVFENKLLIMKNKVLKMTEKQLDKIISGEFKKRLISYNKSNWHIVEIKINEIGVWNRAGGLPLKWTNNSLQVTAEKVKYALDKNPKLLKYRSRYSIKNMLATNVNWLQKEKYLLPIVFKHNTGTEGRKHIKKQTKGDIDDGNMRSIALTINGAKKIKVYFGSPKK